MSHDFGSVHSETYWIFSALIGLIQILNSFKFYWRVMKFPVCVRVTLVNYSFEFAPVHNLCPTRVFFWNLICKPMVLCDGFLHHWSILYFEYFIDNLAGVKVLHGIDKVVEGGAVVLMLKDQNILADGDINEGKLFWWYFLFVRAF